MFGGIGEIILLIWFIALVWAIHKALDGLRRVRHH